MKNKLNQINQFNGGMIKDIEPLMVPNTVMTDCLNGTLITYNGNEFALQNDMGNYGFKNGALSNGFVPVGMKEHQGVLYIISYNPIDDKVEIGSFPSQQTIFTPIVDNKDATIEDIIIDKTSLYKDLEGETKIIFASGHFSWAIPTNFSMPSWICSRDWLYENCKSLIPIARIIQSKSFVKSGGIALYPVCRLPQGLSAKAVRLLQPASITSKSF